MRTANYGFVVSLVVGIGACVADPVHVEEGSADRVVDPGSALPPQVSSGEVTSEREASRSDTIAVPEAITISGGLGTWNTEVEQIAPACTIIKLVDIPLACYGAGGRVQLNLKLPSATGALISRTDTLSSETPYIVLYNIRADLVQEVALTFPDEPPAAICSDQLSISSNPGPVSNFPVTFIRGGVTRFSAGAPWGAAGFPVRSDGQPVTLTDILTDNDPCHSRVSFKVGNATRPIPSAGLHLWLRADAGIVPASGTQIARWLDQSGNERNASMATATRQPSLVSAALNGRPIVRFFGAQSMYLDVPATPTTFSVFVVGKNSSSSESFSMILGPGGNSPNHQLRWENGSQALFVARNAGTIITSSIGNTRAYHALSARYDGSAITFFRDGNATSSSAFTNTIPWTIASVGSWYSSFFMTGDLAEAIIYDRAVTEAERASVNAYLRGKYNLP